MVNPTRAQFFFSAGSDLLRLKRTQGRCIEVFDPDFSEDLDPDSVFRKFGPKFGFFSIGSDPIFIGSDSGFLKSRLAFFLLVRS